MNRNDIVDSLGRIDEEMINEVDEVRGRYKVIETKRPSTAWRKFAALAACVCMVIGGIGHFFSIHGGMGSSGGGEEGITYMSYAGPVFPLTALDDSSDIKAERHLDFDFSLYEDRHDDEYEYEFYNSESIVRDDYILTNDSSEEKTVTLAYPFAGSLTDKGTVKPEVTVNGKPAEAELRIGQPCAGSNEVTEEDDPIESIAYVEIDSWEDYKKIVENGYIESAFDTYPDLEDTKVIVYELTDMYGEMSDDAGAPQLAIEYKADGSKTTVLTSGFDGYQVSGNLEKRSVSIPQSDERVFPPRSYMIVIGDDIADYQVKAYTDGSLAKEMENAGCTVTRYESTLDEIVKEAAAEELKILQDLYREELEDNCILSGISEEEFLGLSKEYIADTGLLKGYDSEMLYDDINDTIFRAVASCERVMYVCFKVTVPAGGSVEIGTKMTKAASCDFVGDNVARNGYDMVTQLGSSLTFVWQKAFISNTGSIGILDQNFGFDIEAGVTEVTLDPEEEHYYLNVSKLGDDGEPTVIPHGARRSPMVVVFDILFFLGLIGAVALIITAGRKE